MKWENIPKQTHLLENGQIGDCWRCCVAAVLGLPAEEVPHFVQSMEAQVINVDADTQEWLNSRGYALVQSEPHGQSSAFQFPRWASAGYGFVMPVIAIGPTNRTGKDSGPFHCVVQVAGRTVYDPHPSNDGLLCVTREYMVVKVISAYEDIVKILG